MTLRHLVTGLILALLCTLANATDIDAGYAALRRGNLGEAVTAFSKAAEAGSVPAQHQLGKLYLSRGSDPQDLERGLRWLNRAATSGEAGAQYTLGLYLVRAEQREEGEQWLRQAAAGGSTQAARYLQGMSQQTPALAPAELASRWRSASRGCRVEELTRLLDAGAAVDTRDEYDRNALHHLVECGDAAGIELVLQHGINIKQRDRYGETALSRAVARDDAALVRLLVQAGADPGSATRSGSTLVHSAVHRNALDTLAALLTGRPALDRTDAQGYSALDRAILQNRERAAQMLRAAGARRGSRLTDAAEERAVAAHLGSGAGSAADWESARQAALQNEFGSLRVLLQHSDNRLAAQVDAQGYSLLLYAAQAGSASSVDLLLAHGANPDHVNKEGYSALMLAARNGQVSVVLSLLERTTEPLRTDTAGRDAIDHALQADQDGVAHTLLASIEPAAATRLGRYLHQAILRGATASTGWLLSRAANTDAPDAAGRAPLWYAAKHCNENLARQLLRRGANVNRADRAEQTPLHIAARENCPAVTALLLDNGAAENGKTALGNTPLLLAATHNAARSALLLIQRGADASLNNNAGETALMHAVRVDNRQLVAALLECGADPYRRNELGDSALTLAEAQNAAVLGLLQQQSPFRLPFLD